MIYEISAGIVIFASNANTEYLLLHHGSSPAKREGETSYHEHWDFIKGNIGKDETPEQAVLREAREEAGLTDLFFVKGFKEKMDYFYKKDGQLVKKEVVVFLGETKTRNIRVSKEHVGYAWLDYDKAYNRLSFRNSKELLKKANEFLRWKGK